MVSADRLGNTVPCLVVHMRTGWTQIMSDKALVTSWLLSGACSSRRLYGGCSAGAFSKAEILRLFSTNSFESSTCAVRHEVRVNLCMTGCSARLFLVLVDQGSAVVLTEHVLPASQTRAHVPLLLQPELLQHIIHRVICGPRAKNHWGTLRSWHYRRCR